MTTITTASISAPVPSEAFFRRWADMATWPEWNSDTEWVVLAGPIRQGARGTLKPKGAPRVSFEVTVWQPGRAFVDTSRLWGARLVFDHRVREHDGLTEITVTVDLHGPLSGLWRLIMAKGLRGSADRDLRALAAVAADSSTPTSGTVQP